MKNLSQLVRKNVWNMKPYSSARDEFKGEASIFLDANESPYNVPYDRYPDPRQRKVKEKISHIRGIAPEQIMLGNGSDEPIDLAIRIFCDPGKDNIVTIDPTYGMYRVAAETNDVEYREVLLDENFGVNADELLAACNDNTKLIFLCSPNNPSGNSLNREEIYKVLNAFEGIVIIDEAYIDFSSQPSFLDELENYPNMIVLQTFSKAWASAGVRLGMAFASEEIIGLFNKVKYPYNVNVLTQEYAIQHLDQYDEIKDWVNLLLSERIVLEKELASLNCVKHIYPSDANFLLAEVEDANAIYNQLVERGIIVRNRNSVSLCRNCLRITIGTPEENQRLIQTLNELS